MFNKSFNLTRIVKDIPSLAIRKQAWLSLVGSVNASLFAAADSIVAKLQALGYDLVTLERREFVALCSGPETGAGKDVIAENRKLYKLADEWRTELAHTAMVTTGRKQDELGTMASTIAMMTGPQKMRDINQDAVPLLSSLGITVTQAQIDAAKKERLATDNQFAEIRRRRAGAVEYVIDNLFATPNDDNDDEHFSTLSPDVKEYLVNKFFAAMNKAQSTAVNNTLFGRTGDTVLGVADYKIIDGMLPKLMEEAYVKEGAKPKRVRKPKAKPAPKMQRAPRPTQKTTKTETLDNGVKVTTATETV